MGEEVPLLNLETDEGFVVRLKKLLGLKAN
jgi:hypothetical protein